MRRVSRRIGLIAIGVSLVSMSTVEAVTVRMVAVGVNGVKLSSPASSVNLSGGDSFEAEILISGWGPEIQDLIVWQVLMDNEAILIPDPPAHCDQIVPLHFDDTFLRPSGAFMNQRGDPNGNGRGVCDAASANAGDSCVNAPFTCRPMCIGGTTEGALCDNGCPGGGTCSSPMCVDSICSENTFAGDRGKPCATSTNQCIGGACVSRSDFIMSGASAICAVSTFQDNYVYGCTVLGLSGIPDPGGELYAGTILLQVKPNATGTFTVGVRANTSSTFFTSAGGSSAPVTSVPLEVVLPPCGVVGACCGAIVGLDVPLADACSLTQEATCIAAGGAYQGDNTDCTDTNPAGVCSCPQVVDAMPPNCAIDARYPQDQGGPPLPRRGLDSVQVTFDTNLSDVITSSDIALQTTCPGFAQAAIDTITPIGGNTIQVDFNRPMAIKTWVCLRFCGDEANKVCWGRLPADVNGDGTAGPSDILEIIDGLNGLVQQGEWQCDVDLSGQCGAPDILGVIDLLNGAGFSQAWNGVSLCRTCPTAP